MADTLLFFLIVWPIAAGLGCWFLRADAFRSLLVIVTGAILAVSAVTLAVQEPLLHTPQSFLGIGINGLIQVADFLLLFVFVFLGFKHKHPLIVLFAFTQILLVGFLEFYLMDHHTVVDTFRVDNLAMIMTLVVSVVGSLICIHALPYMKEHESHLKMANSQQHRFFMILLLFLGAMNGLVLTNNMIYFYFFFEVTTLCSYLLIGHDKTEVATKNSVRALLLNSLGGVSLALGMVWLYSDLGTLNMKDIIAEAPAAGGLILPLAFVCIAGFTKAAQLPFQSWLLGAMVAPTPTSALLHSSTMVKAGVYLAIRFAPAYEGTFLSLCVALVGAFTFLACSALAVGQSNGKKILAYSTIANLGLIFACAGINTSEAITAAIMILVFHAVSKALLFLCVGTIEQKIHSRDLEDMRGLFSTMPATSIITMLGVLTMILPPFGMLLGKWMAIQASADNLFLVIMVAVGSALTVVYWVRWAGGLLASPFMGDMKREHQPALTRVPLLVLLVMAFLVSGAAPWMFEGMVAPALEAWGTMPYTIYSGILDSPAGGFAVFPLILLIGAGVVFGVWYLGKMKGQKAEAPYMGGLHTDDYTQYLGPMNLPVKESYSNYYMEAFFGENKLTAYVNYAAGLLLLLLVGGAI